jgi:hypothetical protein
MNDFISAGIITQFPHLFYCIQNSFYNRKIQGSFCGTVILSLREEKKGPGTAPGPKKKP